MTKYKIGDVIMTRHGLFGTITDIVEDNNRLKYVFNNDWNTNIGADFLDSHNSVFVLIDGNDVMKGLL